MRVRFLLAATSLLAIAGCGSSSDETPAAAPTEVVIATPAPDVAVQQFADTVAASDLYETEAGKLAQEKGSSKAVKDFGAMMVKDHATSTGSLKAALAEANPNLAVTPALTSEQQTKLDQLRAASGTFDQLYALQQVAAHQNALNLLRDYAVNGSDPALRGFASEAAPTVQHHLEEARKLP